MSTWRLVAAVALTPELPLLGRTAGAGRRWTAARAGREGRSAFVAGRAGPSWERASAGKLGLRLPGSALPSPSGSIFSLQTCS